jgi:thiol-disulfide isomerase/thioredoxin
MTETGDYRFLDGCFTDSSLVLSTFDGKHAYLFEWEHISDSLWSGRYYSGNHFSIPIHLQLDTSFSLRSPQTLTQLTNPDGIFPFSLSDLDGDTISEDDDRFKNKAVIVQIMGSWCPNCMDETRYLRDLYKRYQDKGLEIVGITFELSNSQTKNESAVRKMIADLDIPYPVLYGGTTAQSDSVLTGLDRLRSYPTTLFLDRNGLVRRIHTGFYGPGTPEYKRYQSETEQFVTELLDE